jgi:hypothetical protein
MIPSLHFSEHNRVPCSAPLLGSRVVQPSPRSQSDLFDEIQQAVCFNHLVGTRIFSTHWSVPFLSKKSVIRHSADNFHLASSLPQYSESAQGRVSAIRALAASYAPYSAQSDLKFTWKYRIHHLPDASLTEQQAVTDQSERTD